MTNEIKLDYLNVSIKRKRELIGLIQKCESVDPEIIRLRLWIHGIELHALLLSRIELEEEMKQ